MQDESFPLTALMLAHGPFGTAAEAERAAVATLRALGECLLTDELGWLMPQLPERWARELAKAHSMAASEVCEPTAQKSAFVARVAFHGGVRRGVASEYALIACQALAESIPRESLERLKKHLPALAEFFELPEPPLETLAPLHDEQRAPNDLAEGRPGGTHPLASSDLSSLAHEHSVARSDEPHADSKLSSTRGTSQERLESTLARGQPGAHRKISDSH